MWYFGESIWGQVYLKYEWISCDANYTYPLINVLLGGRSSEWGVYMTLK